MTQHYRDAIVTSHNTAQHYRDAAVTSHNFTQYYIEASLTSHGMAQKYRSATLTLLNNQVRILQERDPKLEKGTDCNDQEFKLLFSVSTDPLMKTDNPLNRP
jgi:hypothetical protein